MIFSQEWIYKITNNLLVKTKAGDTKGRDNYGRNKLPKQCEQTAAHLIKKETKLIDENEAIYGIGYLNPAFDDNQCTVINTPEGSPVDIPHRSRKSSAKSEKVKTTIVDVNKTVRRKLDMSSIPDIVQTSQPQVVQIDDDLSCSDTDVHITDEEEFFLSKNSKLFSQVSSNTLTATESKTFDPSCAQQNLFRVVEIKEMEIVKSIASPEKHVILPSANVSVGLMPQVVERVEIEDIETEPESIDTDTEDKEGRGKISSSIGIAEQVNKKKELVPILKKKTAIESPPAKNIKRLILKLKLDTDQENLTESGNILTLSSNTPSKRVVEDNITESPNVINQSIANLSTSPSRTMTSAWKDTESVAEYLILDENEVIEKFDIKPTKDPHSSNVNDAKTTQRDVKNMKETISEKRFEHSRTRENTSNGDCPSPLPKRIKSMSKDDTLEDCESFYGSDKETDDILIFSDDTEIDVGSSSSDGEDTNLKKQVEHLLDKVTYALHICAIDVQQQFILIIYHSF